MRVRRELALLLDRKGLVDLSEGYLAVGEPLVLVAWSCCIVGCCNN